jgi:translation initiation factor IF-3
MTPAQALQIATERTLDLVEIAATATPPVCRIMNSGKYFYQQSKREAEARKEVKFRPKIDEHDFQFKKRNAARFLEEGNKVKSTVIFRGRENAHSEVGLRILERLATELTDVGEVEFFPRQEGNTMIQILAPKKDIKQRAKKEPEGSEPPARKGRAATATSEAGDQDQP